MTTVSEIAAKAVANASEDVQAAGLNMDALARAFITEAIGIYSKNRTANDIANELEFIAEHLDEDEQYTFMRP